MRTSLRHPQLRQTSRSLRSSVEPNTPVINPSAQPGVMRICCRRAVLLPTCVRVWNEAKSSVIAWVHPTEAFLKKTPSRSAANTKSDPSSQSSEIRLDRLKPPICKPLIRASMTQAGSSGQNAENRFHLRSCGATPSPKVSSIPTHGRRDPVSRHCAGTKTQPSLRVCGSRAART